MNLAPKSYLAPGRVVEVLDRTFRVYRDNFVLFIGLTALLLVPLNLLQFVVTEYVFDNQPTPFSETDLSYNYDNYYEDDGFDYEIIAPILGIIILAVQVVLIYPIIAYIASEYYLGRQAALVDAIASVRDRLLPLALALFGLLIVPVCGLMMVLALIAIGGEAMAGLISLILVFVVPTVGLVVFYFFMSAIAFLVPVLVLEKVSIGRGMSRAMGLARLRWWPAFWFFVGVALLYLMSIVSLYGVGGIIAGLMSDQSFVGDRQTVLWLTIINTLINVLLLPPIPIGMTLFYYDTRFRVEGLDMALQLLKTPEPRPSDLPSPDLDLPLIGGRDISNLILLGAGGIGGCSAIFMFLTMTALFVALFFGA